MLKNTKQTFTSFTTKKPSGVQSSDAAATQGLDNDIIIRAARGETTERPAVWLMRQAGRYLPGQYKGIANRNHDFDFSLSCKSGISLVSGVRRREQREARQVEPAIRAVDDSRCHCQIECILQV